MSEPGRNENLYPHHKTGRSSPQVLDIIECSRAKHEDELHEAASKLDSARVRELLQQQQIDVNQLDSRGHSPFHHALNPKFIGQGKKWERKYLARQVKIIELLLVSGADADQVADEKGQTELHKAARSSKLDLVRLLLEYGANAEKADGEGWRPIHLACLSRKTNSFEVVQALLDHGVDVNAKTVDGDAPLHIALRRATEPSTPRFVRLLLAAGTDIFISDPQCFPRLVSRISNPWGNPKAHQYIIYSHMICLWAAEIPINSRNEALMIKLLNIPNQNRRDSQKLAAARRQVVRMRAYRVDNSNAAITLYDILFSPESGHINNRVLVHRFSKLNYKNLSQYKLLLLGRLRRARIHLEVNDAARKILLGMRRACPDLLCLQSLPEELLEKIFDHMQVIDLRNLVISCQKLNKIHQDNSWLKLSA